MLKEHAELSPRGKRGSVLVLAMLALVVMLYSGLTLITLAENATRTTQFAKSDCIALARAEAMLARAQVRLADEFKAAEEQDRELGELELKIYDPSLGGSYYEISRHEVRQGAYVTMPTILRGTGEYMGHFVTLVQELKTYSLLNYSLFCRSGDISLGPNFRTTGDMYAGDDINFNNYPHQWFGGRVEAGDRLLNRGNESTRHFELPGQPVEHVGRLKLDTDETWFQNTQAAAKDSGIWLPGGYDYRIDFTGINWTQGGTITIQRRSHRSDSYASDSGTWRNYTITIPPNFNGIIFAGEVYDDGRVKSRASLMVKGTLQYQSVTCVATDDIFLTGNLYGGTTNGDFVRNGADPSQDNPGTGDPVNVGLVAYDNFRIGKECYRILEYEAAVMAVHGNVKPELYSSYSGSWRYYLNQPEYWGPWDLDMDGQLENPNEWGWNEFTCEPQPGVYSSWRNRGIFHLQTMGPMIHNTQSTTGMWAMYPGYAYPSWCRPNNRNYGYTRDILKYPPPTFPAVLSKFLIGAWSRTKMGDFVPD